MAGDEKTGTGGQGVSPIHLNLPSAYYRERSPDGTFPPRTEDEELRLKGEIARWAALMGLART